MDRVNIRDLGRRDQAADVEITVLGRRIADADRPVGEAQVGSVGVGLGVDTDRLDAELVTGAEDAEGDLAAVGYQDALEHGWHLGSA